jgi:HK97 family phage prohead protease
MTIQFKTFRFADMRVKTDADTGQISGYGSTFGGAPDSYGDVIAPGAFKSSLKQRTPKMLYQHDSGMIAGIWDSAEEDNHGLFLKGHFINTTTSQNAYEECKAGAIDSMSIGFSTLDQDYDPNTGIRTLKEIDLYEVSLVTFAANQNALISAVKNAPTNLRDFERFLREAGYSRDDAITIAKHGFKAIDLQREADPEPSADDANLQAYFDLFKAFN